jgi:hypothetical protein
MNAKHPANFSQKQFLQKHHDQIKHRIQQRLNRPTPTIPPGHTKWTTVTYTSPQIWRITNIFKHTNAKLSFRCNDTIVQLSKPTNRHPTSLWKMRYLLTCNTCQQAHVGQTRRSHNQHYQ